MTMWQTEGCQTDIITDRQAEWYTDKSNSTAGVIQVKANLQEQLSDSLQFRQEGAA